MDLNYFKDVLFDLINDSFRLDIVDIISNDKENTFIIKTEGGDFMIKCSEYKEK